MDSKELMDLLRVRREQFFGVYPSAAQYFQGFGDNTLLMEMVYAGYSSKALWEHLVKKLYPSARGDYGKYVAKYIEEGMKKLPNDKEVIMSMKSLLPYRKTVLKILFEHGLNVQEAMWVRENERRFYYNCHALAPTSLWDKIGNKTHGVHVDASKMLMFHQYRKIDIEELRTIVAAIMRFCNDVRPSHLLYRQACEYETVDHITWYTLRKELKIDHKDSGWASIKRVRKIWRRWEQVDGIFADHLKAEMPYHLQDWISPKGMEIDGYTFTPLTSKVALVAEGDEMDHCVGSYSGQCMSNQRKAIHIYKVTGEGRATLALCEVTMNNRKGYMFRKSQLYSEGNRSVSVRTREACDKFIEELNSKDDFGVAAARKIREDFHNKYSEEYGGNKRDNWRNAIHAILPHFPSLQHLLDREEELFNGGQ